MGTGLYCTLRLRFDLEESFTLLGDDICLSSSLFAGGKFSWSILSNLNLLQSLMTPFGPVENVNSCLWELVDGNNKFLSLTIYDCNLAR